MLFIEFNHLYKINVTESTLDDIWSRTKYYTSYYDYITANPSIKGNEEENDQFIKPKHQFNIFSITHNDQIVADIQLCTSPLLLGDIYQLVLDFSNSAFTCEQVSSLSSSILFRLFLLCH